MTKELERAIRHIKNRADAWAVKEVTDALEQLQCEDVISREAEEYAKNMTYRDAVYNALQGKCIPYRKATLIKLYELLDMVEPQESEDKE